ncbi:hypothetical protein JCM18899A_01570 [Nocardioides sp. AN3]
MEHQFDTPGPTRLFAVLGAGRIDVRASERDTTEVVVTGLDADQTRVEERGGQIMIVAPRQRGLFGRGGIDVTVDLPSHSDLRIKTGSAEVVVTGDLSAVLIQTGSGAIDVEHSTGATALETGSGHIQLGDTDGDVRIKSGSGDVSIGAAARTVVASLGSGDVELGSVGGTVRVKSGSGDLRVHRATGDISLTTGSGDLEVDTITRGRVNGKGGSGDIRVGVPAGIPVWTDVSTISGRITSTLPHLGEPAPGQDHVEVRVHSGSGDITLVSL